MASRLMRAPHLRLVKAEARYSEWSRGRTTEDELDDRARAIALAITEELATMRATAMAPPARVDLSLHVGLVAESEHWVGFTESVGACALFVATYLTRPIGTELRVLLELPSGHVVDAVAKVAGVREEVDGPVTLPGMELRLVTMSDDDGARLADLVEVSSPDFWRGLFTERVEA
jgi:hypothetical protein